MHTSVHTYIRAYMKEESVAKFLASSGLGRTILLGVCMSEDPARFEDSSFTQLVVEVTSQSFIMSSEKLSLPLPCGAFLLGDPCLSSLHSLLSSGHLRRRSECTWGLQASRWVTPFRRSFLLARFANTAEHLLACLESASPVHTDEGSIGSSSCPVWISRLWQVVGCASA